MLAFAAKHADLLLLIALTAIAAVPRLWALGEIPQGVHGDEAQVGMDAWRVLEEGLDRRLHARGTGTAGRACLLHRAVH